MAFRLTSHRQQGAVRVLCALNIGASLLIWISMLIGYLTGTSGRWWEILFGLPGDFPLFLHRPWTLCTYMIAQVSPLQLLFNMLWLVWFGRILADRGGDRLIYTLYIGGGLAGGLAYLAAAAAIPGAGSFLIGSSAATLSVMIYATMANPGLHVPLLLIGEVRLKWIAVFTVILTLLGATGIAAHCAHLAGIAFPFAYRAWLRVRTRPRQPRRRVPAAMSQGNVYPEELLDALLDKIRVSGFDSLTLSEKKRLDQLSQTIKNKV